MKLNPVLDKLAAYKAGPPLAEVARRYQLARVAQLSANESPWGPFPEVVEAMHAALEGLNRYPDGGCDRLRGLLADRLRVPAGHLVFGNGSCELLMLLGEALLGPETHAVFPHPSFVMYRSIAVMRGAPYTSVPLPGLDYDLEAVAAAIGERTSLVIICNPNNPTGSYLEPDALRNFLERVPADVVVAFDEAYGEFVSSSRRAETARWVSEYPNLVVLRTFSKIYGLAGLRVGYAVADPKLVEALDKIRQPFNVDSLAQVAAARCLELPERVEERRRLVAEERARLGAALDRLGIAYHPSEANFLLVDVTNLGVPGPEAAQALLERGVLTRSGYAMGCPGWIRVTIGTVEENDLFLGAIAELKELGPTAVRTHPVKDLTADVLSPES